MEKTMIPQDYHSELNLHDTQIAIKTVKDFFQNLLSERLHLARVSAPLFVDPESGLNDNLNNDKMGSRNKKNIVFYLIRIWRQKVCPFVYDIKVHKRNSASFIVQTFR